MSTLHDCLSLTCLLDKGSWVVSWVFYTPGLSRTTNMVTQESQSCLVSLPLCRYVFCMPTQQSIGRAINSFSSISQVSCFSLMFSEKKSLTWNLGEATFSLCLRLWTSNLNLILHCDKKQKLLEMSHKTKQYYWLFQIIHSVCNTFIPADLYKCSVWHCRD